MLWVARRTMHHMLMLSYVRQPSWVDPIQSNVQLSNFGGSLSYSRLIDKPDLLVLSWVDPVQSNVSLSNFGGALSYNRLVDKPDLLVPSWVDQIQSNVLLDAFGGELALSRIVLPMVIDNSPLAQINVTITIRLRGAK